MRFVRRSRSWTLEKSNLVKVSVVTEGTWWCVWVSWKQQHESSSHLLTRSDLLHVYWSPPLLLPCSALRQPCWSRATRAARPSSRWTRPTCSTGSSSSLRLSWRLLWPRRRLHLIASPSPWTACARPACTTTSWPLLLLQHHPRLLLQHLSPRPPPSPPPQGSPSCPSPSRSRSSGRRWLRCAQGPEEEQGETWWWSSPRRTSRVTTSIRPKSRAVEASGWGWCRPAWRAAAAEEEEAARREPREQQRGSSWPQRSWTTTCTGSRGWRSSRWATTPESSTTVRKHSRHLQLPVSCGSTLSLLFINHTQTNTGLCCFNIPLISCTFLKSSYFIFIPQWAQMCFTQWLNI